MATLAQGIPVYRPARISRVLILAGVLLVALTIVVMFGLTLGTPQLTVGDLDRILLHNEGTRLARIVVIQIRIPRVLLGLLAGAMLALAGTLLQDSMRNALAGPELIGVSAGCSVVIAAITIFHLPLLWELYPFAALAGGMAAGSIVILTMRRLGDPIRLILMGVAMSALLYAAIISIVMLGNQQDVGILYLYLLGSIANRTWHDLLLVLPWALIGIPLALLAARPLNLLQLGDEVAEGLGLHVVRIRLLLVLLSAGLVAGVVSTCGPIGYVALAAPHLARRILRTTDDRQVLPIAALLGALLLTGADLIAKNLFDPQELPVGIWTTLIGGPLLILMLRRQLGGARNR